jgi:hypothetical protein
MELPVGTNLVTFTLEDVFTNRTIVAQAIVVQSPTSANTNLSITELMAKNVTSITDEDGTHADWIELFNQGACPLNLDGWFLTDDATNLAKWRFPATNIAPGQFLVVWASEKDRLVPGAPLHTNFKLSENGEYLALVQPDGVTIATEFSPAFPGQQPDGTYGVPAGGGTNNFLASSTPGESNSPAITPNIDELTFLPPRGWYTNPVSVTIHTPTEKLVAGLRIYYTTNGTAPGPTNGLLYNQPVSVARTMVLRAGAFREGWTPSSPQTHTYIFPTQVAQQTGAGFPTNWGTYAAIYTMHPTIVNDPEWKDLIPGALVSLPTMSIALEPEHMFGTNGIYSNPLGDGVDWERPCSVEFLRRDAEPGFQLDCGIQIQGDLSRDPDWTLKHNFRLYFRQSYGAGKLNYQLYPDSPIDEFNTVVLHASFNDHWIAFGARAQMLRDLWFADTQQEVSGIAQHGLFVHLYINGLYWGLYRPGERTDVNFAASYIGGKKEDYDGFNGDDLKDGSTNARNEMLTIARAGITNEVAYTNLSRYLDIPDFIDYMLINFYGANLDWPGHNYWLLGAVEKGIPFQFLSWDAEVSFFGINWDLTGVTEGTPGELYASLRQYPDFRRLFGDRAHRLLFGGGALTPEPAADRWMRRAQQIHEAIVPESARWGVSWRTNTPNDWLEEQNYLMTEWFPQRTAILLGQLRAAGLYPLLDAPVLHPDGGMIDPGEPGAVTMTAPAGNIYYTTNGTDPRLPDGNISAAAQQYQGTLLLTGDTQIQARAFATNTWSALVHAEYIPGGSQLRIRDITRQDDGTIQLELRGPPGASYTVHASTNLIDWTALVTPAPGPDGSLTFIDSAATNAPTRFYKLSAP